MSVKELLRSPLAKGPTCAGDLGFYNARYSNRTSCKRDAQYLVDGRPLCQQHAGKVLIESAIDGPAVPYQGEPAPAPAAEPTKRRRGRPPKRRPLPHEATTPPAPARAVVSDLNYLEARDRLDPLWPADKDAELRRLAALNLSTGVISAEIGRSYTATERRLAKLGIRPLAGKLERENAL